MINFSELKKKMQNKEVKSYSIQIFWSEEDKAYIAKVKELKGCSAFGNTQEEALQEVKTAIRLWIESAISHKDPIPKPDLFHKF